MPANHFWAEASAYGNGHPAECSVEEPDGESSATMDLVAEASPVNKDRIRRGA